MRSRLFALLLLGAAVIPGTARAQQLESPAALIMPGSGGPALRSSIPVVHLGYSFPMGANAPPVSGYVPAAFAPATASYQGYRNALSARTSSFAPVRYGSIYTAGALTAAYPPMAPAGTVTAVNTPSGTAVIPLQAVPTVSPREAPSPGYTSEQLSQSPNVMYGPMTSSSFSQATVYPWSAYSGPLRRTYQGY
jgi:hypothetical protein